MRLWGPGCRPSEAWSCWGLQAATDVTTLPTQLKMTCMQAVWNFLLLGLPGGVMMALDAASFDITTVMAGFLGE